MAAAREIAWKESPKSARLRFSTRSVNNYLLVGVVFLVASITLNLVLRGWVVVTACEVVLILLLYALYRSVLKGRAIWMRCPQCQSRLSTHSPWKCGECGFVNRNAGMFPFVHICEKCGTAPLGYKCDSKLCNHTIFFSDDEREIAVASKPTPTMEPSIARDEALRAKQHKIALAELNERLNVIKKRNEPVKVKDPSLRLSEELDALLAEGLGAETVAQKKRALLDEEFKDDPEGKKRAHLLIEKFLRQRL
jgi:hypothetical protein